MFTKEVRSIDPDPQPCGSCNCLLRYLTLTLKELTLFTNVTKLEKFVVHEVCVSSEFEKSEKSQKNSFRQGENLRLPQIRLFQGQIRWKNVLLECGVRGNDLVPNKKTVLLECEVRGNDIEFRV